VLSGYRGFARELARTGSWRALALQLRTGARHATRRLLRRATGDPIAAFLASYGPDGFRLPDAARARLQLAAESCLACGLCNVACARAAGAPALEPRDAVVAAARLEVDWIRLGHGPFVSAQHDAAGAGCAACAACEPACPAGIPIAALQETLARFDASAVATASRIR
jgi:succinate dehydrogenase/fumarate reductase-like Fe-S protein